MALRCDGIQMALTDGREVTSTTAINVSPQVYNELSAYVGKQAMVLAPMDVRSCLLDCIQTGATPQHVRDLIAG